MKKLTEKDIVDFDECIYDDVCLYDGDELEDCINCKFFKKSDRFISVSLLREVLEDLGDACLIDGCTPEGDFIYLKKLEKLIDEAFEGVLK